MSPFLTPSPMPANPLAKTLTSRTTLLRVLSYAMLTFLLGACSTPGQQLADAEIKALNSMNVASATSAANTSSTAGAQVERPAPYIGSYGPNDPPRMTSNSSGYDPFNSELSDSIGVPFLSFLIIEPDPVTKNGVPADIERLVKAKQYPEAIELINQRLKKTPGNVQLRYVKARMQIEMQQWEPAKKTLIEITQQFPELPEPYNNLAALAANQKNWIEARDYLELALKLRPSYVIASANLGEVYIRLGAQAYDNAAKDAPINQRQYSNKAKALLEILKPPKKPVQTNIAPIAK
ncbi:tetratricopeptide repeat protein [Polynucleobacter brandtiae]|uniref:Tetratricopeptide repeat protein n=2 Tax=Polynucleobacter brandtiae TaxID=1938816 RepID=A0A2M8VXV1_9BURK|nr:tetratricopeptide repeat protein [Polynucleobacter brandtiae]